MILKLDNKNFFDFYAVIFLRFSVFVTRKNFFKQYLRSRKTKNNNNKILIYSKDILLF